MINKNFQIKLDDAGNFDFVIYKNRKFTIDEWNSNYGDVDEK